MANIRVFAQVAGGIALSLSVASVSASALLQEKRIRLVATPSPLVSMAVAPQEQLTSVSVFSRPATIPIISNIFPLPLTPLSSESVFAAENLVFTNAFNRVFDDEAVAAEEVMLIADFDRIFADSITATEDKFFGVDKLLLDSVVVGELAAKTLERPFADSVTSSELPALFPGKSFSDSITSAEFDAKDISKVAVDSVTTTEDFNRVVAFNRAFTDSVTVFEALTAVDKDKIVETTTATDFEVALNLSKPLSDAAVAVEFAVFDADKVFADSVAAAESIDTTTSFLRDFADSAESLEASFRIVGKTASDSVTTLEDSQYAVGKVVSDTATAQEQTTKTVLVPFADVVTAAELDEKSLNKPLTDAITGTEFTAKAITTPITDLVTSAESAVYSTGKVVSDAATAADSPEFTVSYLRTFADSVTVIETISAFSKDKGVETVAATDFEVDFAVAKPVLDAASATEDDSKTLSKLLSHSVSALEARAFNTSIVPTDAVVSVDSFAFAPIKYAQDSVSVSEVINLIFTSGDRAEINRLQLNVGMVNGFIFEIAPTDGVWNGIEVNGLMLNQSM